MAAQQTATPARERWSTEAGARDVAWLDIPADARRDREFEIDCQFIVKTRPDAVAPWHAMRVTVDGALEWSRRIDTHNPGSTDSLDYRFRRVVPPGQSLRVAVTTSVRAALRVALTIRAEED